MTPEETMALVPRRKRRALRKDVDGLTWTLYPSGGSAVIEMRFDDDPEPILRERRMTKDEASALIEEQLADGFVLEPPWQPNAEWFASADDTALSREVLDVWLLGVLSGTCSPSEVPPEVLSYLVVDGLISQTLRSGLNAFLGNHAPWFVRLLPRAADDLGFAELGKLFELATEGADVEDLCRRAFDPGFKFPNEGAARKLSKRLNDMGDFTLLGWVREHAEAFAVFPSDL